MVICAQIEMKNQRYQALEKLREQLKSPGAILAGFENYSEENRTIYGRDETPSQPLIIGHTGYPRQSGEVRISLFIRPKQQDGEIKFFTQSTDSLTTTIQAIKKLTKLEDLEITPIPMAVISI